MRNRLLLACALAWSLAGTANAQDQVFVRIETNLDGALLFADSMLVGAVSDGPVALPSASRMLRLVAPERNSWSIAPVTTELNAAPGDTLTVRLEFPYYYRVESRPFGADVFVEHDRSRRRIGETPLLYRSEQPLVGSLLVVQDGYGAERVSPGTGVWNRHVVDLELSDTVDPTAAQVSWTPPRRHRAWIDYVALGSAVAAGALAVHYKFRADDLYSEFEESGDPTLQPQIHSFDTRAGVAFGAMQVGVGIFALRLILR